MGIYNLQRQDPLLEYYGSYDAEQWIFPDLQFICSGRLTKWTLRAAYTRATSSQCRIHVGVWRLDRNSVGTIYRKLSTTAQGARITKDGLIITYEFDSPVEIQPGDIVGIEQDLSACPTIKGYDDILSLEIGDTGSISKSYRQFGTGSMFNVTQDPTTYLIPFLQPVIGKLMMQC